MKADSRAPNPFPPLFANAWGDDEFGLWAEIAVTDGAPDSAVVAQLLRWIEPGEFSMGSPENESGREPEEGPRHLVTLSQGFWLADTACTQALWQCVMGTNPSHFLEDVLCPVENLSWNDVQAFLIRLNQKITGGEACLPTEAQWEYACRAGTETSYSFGDQISAEQVNYNGNLSYAGGTKTLYRKRTVPVKSMPPNDWGLYECHGNVWEWCEDGSREYNSGPKLDPLGSVAPDNRTPRVLRGGSWNDDVMAARSAQRDTDNPDLRAISQGFRFCVKSIKRRPAR